MLIFSLRTKAQTAANLNTDSLENIITSGKINNSNLSVFRLLASHYLAKASYDSAEYFYREGYRTSIRLKNNRWTSKYTLWLGGFYTHTTNYDSAVKYLDLSFSDIKELKNDSLLAQYYHTYGVLYIFQSNNDKAADYMLKAIAILEKMGDKRPLNLLPQSYSNMSAIFDNERQPEKAVPYDKKALQVKEEMQDPTSYASLYFNVATTFTKLNDETNAKIYLDSANTFNAQFYHPRVALNIASAYGLFHEKADRYDSALAYYKRAIELSKETGELYFFPEQAFNASNMLLKLNRAEEAKKLLEESIPVAKEYQDYLVLSLCYGVQKEIAVRNKDYKTALAFDELHKQYADSATNAETQKSILTLEAKYENQKKEKEIAGLKVINTQKELAVVKRNWYLMLGGVIATSMLVVLGLLYRGSKQKQTIAEKEQKLQLEQIKFLERQQQVVSLQSMINGQETERTRVARELHDGLGGLFSTVKMHFSALEHEHEILRYNELFKKSHTLVDTASTELRRIAHNMMPEVLMKLGLINAIKDLADNISAGKLLKVTLQVHGMHSRLNSNTEVTLYRIIQELLNNIIKHAMATEAIIQFIKDNNRLSVIVEDNGRGFNTLEADEKIHAGIETIKSRVNYLNGKLTIDSQKNAGTTIMMDFLINEI